MNGFMEITSGEMVLVDGGRWTFGNISALIGTAFSAAVGVGSLPICAGTACCIPGVQIAAIAVGVVGVAWLVYSARKG